MVRSVKNSLSPIASSSSEPAGASRAPNLGVISGGSGFAGKTPKIPCAPRAMSERAAGKQKRQSDKASSTPERVKTTDGTEENPIVVFSDDEEKEQLRATLKVAEGHLQLIRKEHNRLCIHFTHATDVKRELQTTNAELQSTNAELQSTIGKLNSTIAELQSANAKLRSANAEVKAQFRGVSSELNALKAESAASSSARTPDADEPKCVICLEAKRTHAMLPCGHLCLCSDCCAPYLQHSGNCPVCRAPGSAVYRIYL